MVSDVHETGPLRNSEGLILGLYHHLWSKNHRGENCNVNIPHTVIYRNSQPVAWYFTSVKEQKIMRKKKSSVESRIMVDAFMAGQASQPEVCAWFSGNMTKLQSSPRKTHSQSAGRLQDNGPGMEELAMEYLTYDRVKGLLRPAEACQQAADRMYDGIMQKFVEARDPRDFIIRATWSPTACAFEKYVNRHRLLHQEDGPLTDRIASLNGNVWLHEHVPISGGVLSDRLEAQCSAVVRHLKEVSHGQTNISSMELFFKIDRKSRIWLLFCSSLQLEQVAPLRIVFNRAADGGSFVLKDPSTSETVPIEVEERPTFQCAMTGRTCEASQRVQVTYKLILQHWYRQCSQLASEGERIHAIDNIPPTIRRANPNMTRDYYLQNRSQPFFLVTQAEVCPQAEAALKQAAQEGLADTLGRPTGPRPQRSASAGPTRSTQSARAASSQQFAGLLTGKLRPQTARPASGGMPSSGGMPPAGSGPGGLPPRYQQRSSGAWLDEPWEAPAAKMQFPSALLPKAARTPTPSSASPPLRAASPSPQPEQATSRTPIPSHRSPSPSRPHQVVIPTFLQPSRSRPQAQSPLRAPHAPGSLHSISEGAGPRCPSSAANTKRSSSPTRGFGGDAAGLRRSSLIPASSCGASASASEWGAADSAAGLGDTIRSTASAGSRRSRHSNYLSGDELKTLRELSDAYSQAEQVTQNLLDQAHQLLKAPSSRSSPAGVQELPRSSHPGGAGTAAVPQPNAAIGELSRQSAAAGGRRPQSAASTRGTSHGTSLPGTAAPLAAGLVRPPSANHRAAVKPQPSQQDDNVLATQLPKVAHDMDFRTSDADALVTHAKPGPTFQLSGSPMPLTSEEAELLSEALNEL